jgi:hypothetical protein
MEIEDNIGSVVMEIGREDNIDSVVMEIGCEVNIDSVVMEIGREVDIDSVVMEIGCEDNIDSVVMEIGCEVDGWMQQAQDRFRWRTFVLAVMISELVTLIISGEEHKL